MNKTLWAILVKANAGYRCAQCGSTEFLQAHDPTGRHIDPRDGNCLCGDCHAKQHPNIPLQVFTSPNHQPYWHNLSASSVAKILGVHPRTIWRWARKLKVPKGNISDSQIEEIKRHLHYQYKELKRGVFIRTKYKIRGTGGHRISLPPAWIEGRNIEEVELFYDPLAIVIIPPGIKVNEKVLEGAFEREKLEKLLDFIRNRDSEAYRASQKYFLSPEALDQFLDQMISEIERILFLREHRKRYRMKQDYHEGKL